MVKNLKSNPMKYDAQFSEIGINDAFGRLGRIRTMLKKELTLTKDDIVLDVGCDKGDLVSFLRPHCQEMIGIDINKDAINESSIPNLTVVDARETDFPDNYFTKIVSSHTVEHVPNLIKLFREIDRITKPHGLIVLYYPWELFKGMGTMRNAWKFYRNPFKGYKIHINKLSHNKIGKLIQGTNLKIIKRKFFFDPQPGYITILRKTD